MERYEPGSPLAEECDDNNSVDTAASVEDDVASDSSGELAKLANAARALAEGSASDSDSGPESPGPSKPLKRSKPLKTSTDDNEDAKAKACLKILQGYRLQNLMIL